MVRRYYPIQTAGRKRNLGLDWLPMELGGWRQGQARMRYSPVQAFSMKLVSSAFIFFRLSVGRYAI